MDRVRWLLLESGGIESPVTADFEAWRIRYGGSTFTAYTSLKLYATPSDSLEVAEIVRKIDNLVGDFFVSPNVDYLIGCDESGKGEVLGSIFVTCAGMPSELFADMQDILRTIDTKSRRHPFEYWKDVYLEVYAFKKNGLEAVIKRIGAETVDSENINLLLDRAYSLALQKILALRKGKSYRVVIDDYGVGEVLIRTVNSLVDGNVIIEHKADEKYLEVVVASVISKYFREKEMWEINSDERWELVELTPGPGSSNNEQTLQWLRMWYKKHGEWPPFVRKSYRTVKIIEDEINRR
jgi:ribonuclease HII